MIDHVSILVSDAARSLDFYLAALGPLGYVKVMDLSRSEIPELGSVRIIGLGAGGKPDFWIAQHEGDIGAVHIAFAAESREAVDGFHAGAIGAGGKDNGKPGLREHYHPNYYGAFVHDPDGHNVETVCHKPG